MEFSSSAFFMEDPIKEVSWHYSSGHNGESLEKRMSKSDKKWSAVGPQVLGADNAASSGCGLVAIRGRGQGDANSSAARAGIDVNATVVIEHGPFDDRQTQSHAARFCRTERRENLLAHFR